MHVRFGSYVPRARWEEGFTWIVQSGSFSIAHCHFQCKVGICFVTLLSVLSCALTPRLSSKDYIQQTGRGGRDGRTCHCVLFYRHQDRTLASNIVNGVASQRIDGTAALLKRDNEKGERDLDNVCKVCGLSGRPVLCI
jgi:hypothetical protein